jgi:periplasmic copper chaperone A
MRRRWRCPVDGRNRERRWPEDGVDSMQSIRIPIMIIKTLVVAAALAWASCAAVAQDYKAGSIEISGPWVRATPKGASVASGYLKLTNNGSEPDRLIGGTSDISGKLEIHEMTMANGVMRMRPLANGLEIKPGQSVELTPGTFHLMFVGLKQQLQQGQKIKGRLTFAKAGSVEVEFAVGAIGASSAVPAGSEHMHMHMQ